uniref:Peptidase M13 C-terminal domain-containing protein n=1 Tax=viral metagenome TaxID=1070528 RepID=A0A6C0JEF2_9ZZZZ
MVTKKHNKKGKDKAKNKNRTLKNKNDNTSGINSSVVCKKNFNSYHTFEDKIEDMMKKNKIDFQSTNYDLEKNIIKSLKDAEKQGKIKPENDYYSYINERWLKSYNEDVTQKYFVQFDDFRLVQDKVFRELLVIIDNYAAKHKKSKDPFNVSFMKFYKSTTIIYSKKKFFLQHAYNIMSSIDNLFKENNLWKLLAHINENEIINWGCPIRWTLNPDDKNPTIFRSYINGPTLSILDISVYFDDGTKIEYKKNYRNKYIKNIKQIFYFFFGENNQLNANDVFDVEVKIAHAFSCNNIKPKEHENNYNKVTKKEALERFQLNWDEFAKELGFKHTPDFFITSDLNYLQCITQLLLKEWNTPEWRTYWIYLYLKALVRFNTDGGDIYFSFHGKFEKGIISRAEFNLYRVILFGFTFNTFLTNEYVKAYKNDENVNYVKTMAEDLKTVFIRIIKRNKWLQPKTKEKALKKLHNFTLQVGAPNKLTPDPILDYDYNDLWGNLILVSKWRHTQAVSLEGKPVIDFPILDWSQMPPKFVSTQAYVVNASYTPSKNGIYVPLGYIQKPFVDLDERGIEYNLAHIGFTLAHEMSHALDDWGSQYDENGKLNNWWTPEDRKKFRKIQEDVVKQYETFAAYDGLKFDAWPSIGEDLADISGMTICREYLRDFQLKNEDILPIVDLSFRVFFVYFAFQQRQKISKKALKAQLTTNPHPLDKYRCNVPLSRLPTFRTIYNVEKGDKMWWHSTNRVWEG